MDPVEPSEAVPQGRPTSCRNPINKRANVGLLCSGNLCPKNTPCPLVIQAVSLIRWNLSLPLSHSRGDNSPVYMVGEFVAGGVRSRIRPLPKQWLTMPRGGWQSGWVAGYVCAFTLITQTLCLLVDSQSQVRCLRSDLAFLWRRSSSSSNQCFYCCF